MKPPENAISSPCVSSRHHGDAEPSIIDQIRQLDAKVGTDREWSCIQVMDEEGPGAVVALCHPCNAKPLAAGITALDILNRMISRGFDIPFRQEVISLLLSAGYSFEEPAPHTYRQPSEPPVDPILIVSQNDLRHEVQAHHIRGLSAGDFDIPVERFYRANTAVYLAGEGKAHVMKCRRPIDFSSLPQDENGLFLAKDLEPLLGIKLPQPC